MNGSRLEARYRCYRPCPGAAVRLACFPHAGGGPSFFRRWSILVPPQVEVVGARYPGREDCSHEAFSRDLHSLADSLAPPLLAPGADLDLVLFGHSMGALVAYEVARRLETARPGAVRSLVVSGHPGPPRRRPGRLHLEPDAVLWADVSSAGATPPELLANAELRELVTPVLRHDYRLVETYQEAVGTPLTCPVTVCRGDADSKVDDAEARSWDQVTEGSCRVVVFVGGHFYFTGRERELLAVVLAGTGVATEGVATCPT